MTNIIPKLIGCFSVAMIFKGVNLRLEIFGIDENIVGDLLRFIEREFDFLIAHRTAWRDHFDDQIRRRPYKLCMPLYSHR